MEEEPSAIIITNTIAVGLTLRPLWIANARQNVFWRSIVERHLQPGDIVHAASWQGAVCLRVGPVASSHRRGGELYFMIGDPKRQRHLYRAS